MCAELKPYTITSFDGVYYTLENGDSIPFLMMRKNLEDLLGVDTFGLLNIINYENITAINILIANLYHHYPNSHPIKFLFQNKQCIDPHDICV